MAKIIIRNKPKLKRYRNLLIFGLEVLEPNSTKTVQFNNIKVKIEA